MSQPVEIAGERFGRMVVIGEAPRDKSNRSRVVCRCDCGVTKTVYLGNLRQGRTQSCGCFHQEMRGLVRLKHGHACIAKNQKTTRTYNSWASLIQRCTNPNRPDSHNYGGRGITVCERWKSFENFLADMGERPENTSIDRINVNGNYEPSNCCWATASEQNGNQRRSAVEKVFDIPAANSTKNEAAPVGA